MEIIKSQKGSLSVLGGKTDMGKSTIATFDAAEQLRDGQSVMFFSYEYCQSVIYSKLVTHFGLKFTDLFKLNVIDSSGWKFDQLKEIIRLNKGNVDAVYIDYLDLLTKTTVENYSSSTNFQKMEYKQKVLQELASLAAELNISIVILARIHASLGLNETIDYLNMLAATVTSPAPVIKMFLGKDEALNPMIKGSDMSHVIIVDGNELTHFSSINLKQAYKN